VRSDDLDVESNCIIVFNDANDENKIEDNAGTIKENVSAEWNSMCESSNELAEDLKVADDGNTVMRVVLKFMKRFL